MDENLATITPEQGFKGSGLAQQLRDKLISNTEVDFPIVLISAEDKFERFYRPDGTAHDLFDRTYVKEFVSENKDVVRGELYALCEGYSALKSAWNSADRPSVFGLNTEECYVIDTLELRHMLSDAAAPHIAARIILRNVVDRAGILLADRDIAARLGISPNGLESLTQFLTEAGIPYDGIFSSGWRRWWSHRFDIWAEALFGRRPTSLTGSERALLLKERLGIDLEPAKSTWNGSSDERFAFACASCHFPTEVRHSLTAYDPFAPRFAQHRRICWDCIQTDKYERKHLRIDAIDEPLKKGILDSKR